MTELSADTQAMNQLAQTILSLPGLIADVSGIQANESGSPGVMDAFYTFSSHARVALAERSLSLHELGSVAGAAAGVYDNTEQQVCRVFTKNGRVL